MKSRFLIIIILLVAAVHLTLFVLTPRHGSGDSESSNGEVSRSTETADTGTQRIESSLPQPTSTATDDSTHSAVAAVDDAVGLIQKHETVAAARTVSEPPAPRSHAPAPQAATSSPESDATMIVGLVDGNSKLPPELFEIAEEGAKAVASQNWERARELYLKMVAEAPENALAYANLGVAEHQLGNLLAAAGNLQKSLEINPSIAQNWQTLGIIRYERGELELAISALTRAIHEDPSDARSRLYLAAVIRTYGWIEASITELERAVEIDPRFADAHYNLAVSYLEVEPPRTELARRHYYSAVDLGAEVSSEMEAVFRSNNEND